MAVTKNRNNEPLFHHWLELLSKKFKQPGEYTLEEKHEISNLAMYLCVDMDKELHRERSRNYLHN